MEKDKLTFKQQRFCAEYLKDSNATKAAERAGYSDKTAMEQGYQLLQKTSVLKEITRLQKDLAEATGIEVKTLVQELVKVALSNISDMLEPTSFEQGAVLEIKDLSELTEAQRASIQEISETTNRYGTIRKIKLHSKLTAIDMLMKNLGGYVTGADLIDKLPPERLDHLVDEILQKLKR